MARLPTDARPGSSTVAVVPAFTGVEEYVLALRDMSGIMTERSITQPFDLTLELTRGGWEIHRQSLSDEVLTPAGRARRLRTVIPRHANPWNRNGFDEP